MKFIITDSLDSGRDVEINDDVVTVKLNGKYVLTLTVVGETVFLVSGMGKLEVE